MNRQRSPSAARPARRPAHRPYPRARIAQAARSGLLFSADAMAHSLSFAAAALGLQAAAHGTLRCTSRMLGVNAPVLWQLHQAHGLHGQLCTADCNGLVVGYRDGPQFAADVHNANLTTTPQRLPNEEQALESLVDSGDMPVLHWAYSDFAEQVSDMDQYLFLVYQQAPPEPPPSALPCAISILPITLDWMNPYENIDCSRPWFNGRTLIVQRQGLQLLQDIGHGRD
ncbi:MAG: hypothetical protein LBE51_20165 [Acidovorax sp.]|jgi:hypothetical protein|nr:hypothetical protein [Acidovorax sp.]